MKKLTVIVLTAVALMAAASPAKADEEKGTTPLQLSIYNPWQLVNEDQNVLGLRLNLIYGVNQDVTGIDLGVANSSKGYEKGLMWGIFNSTEDFTGVQVGLINKTDWLTGLQFGLINITTMEKHKWIPFCNFSF